MNKILLKKRKEFPFARLYSMIGNFWHFPLKTKGSTYVIHKNMILNSLALNTVQIHIHLLKQPFGAFSLISCSSLISRYNSVHWIKLIKL